VYHILGFIAVILCIVFIWTVGNYDTKLGLYFSEISAAVIFFFMTGLIMLAKRLIRKAKERENETAQAGSDDEEEVKDNFGKELYLISKREGDTIGYRVENEEKEAVFDAVGKLIQGRVDSIELCAQESDAGADILVTREQNAKEYSVREGERVLGTIKVRKEGLVFAGADDTVCYLASFADEHISEEDEAVEGIMTLVTLGMISRGAKANKLLIKGPGDKVLGKYFFPLRNLDLTDDRNNLVDRRIAVVLAVMADAKLQLTERRNPS